MSHIYSSNPIKINIYDSLTKQYLGTTVFIGTVDLNIEKILIKLQNNKSISSKEKKTLSKFYGKSWKKKLAIDLDTNISIKGGKNIVTGGKDLLDSLDISLEDIEQLEKTEETNDEDDEKDYIQKEKKRKTKTTITSKGYLRYIFDISIYPEDKISEFKQKIFLATKIPQYRQHIWFKYRNINFPLAYDIINMDQNTKIPVKPLDDFLKEDNEIVENLPVTTKYYKIKDSLKVKGNDMFTIIGDYYYKYGINTFNISDLDDFIVPVRGSIEETIKDKYQLELIYYSFIIFYWPYFTVDSFSDYINSEKVFKEEYPDLAPNYNDLKRKYDLEKEITDIYSDISSGYMKKEEKDISNILDISITSSILSIFESVEKDPQPILYVRNLFDHFALDNNIDMLKASILYEGKRYTLIKTYKAEPGEQHVRIKEKIPMNSLMFRIRLDLETTQYMYLILYKNGNYNVVSRWREEDQYDFQDIYDTVDAFVSPVIKRINNMKEKVLYNGKKINLMTKNNVKFTEIGLSLFWRKSLSSDQFDILKQKLNEFRKAGIIVEKNTDFGVLEYYFSKGMYQYDANRIEKNVITQNYYEYMSNALVKQKWNTIFERTRVTKIIHRFSDVKIEIIGIKEKEFDTFYYYIMTLIHLFNETILKMTDSKSKKKAKTEIVQRKLGMKKKLSNLKQQDPALYDFKLYGSNTVYSKICQKPYQPLLLNKNTYNSLPKHKKDKAIKYINHTTGETVYYLSPNPKFPYVKFIVGKHPKGYCIPCAKKTPITKDKDDPKKIIFDMCLKEGKYLKKTKTITTSSRYIMAYGFTKEIEVGRLSRIPEDTMEALFYETYSSGENTTDQECITNNGYFLYGVPQYNENLNNIGYVFCLAHSLGLTIKQLIQETQKKIKKYSNKFSLIMDGKICKYFSTSTSFNNTLQELFLTSKSLVTEKYHYYPWNEMFMSIGFLYFNINTIYFSNRSQADTVNLILPPNVKNSDYLLVSDHKHLLILRKRNHFYPIYVFNTELYFKTGVIETKLFGSKSSTIITIANVIDTYLQKSNFSISENSGSRLELSDLYKFVDSVKNKQNWISNITKLYVNKLNLCYGVEIDNKYLPIHQSLYFGEEEDKDITFKPFYMKSNNLFKLETLMKLIKIYNKSRKSQNIKIHIQKWLIQVENPSKPLKFRSLKVIGFIWNNLNFYIKPISTKKARKYKSVSFLPILYNPNDINKAIHLSGKGKTIDSSTKDKRCKLIGKSIYNNYLYQLLLLEFMTLFNKQKNKTLRLKLKKLIVKTKFNKQNSMEKFETNLKNLIINSKSRESLNITESEDILKIRNQVMDYLNSEFFRKGKIKELLQMIDKTDYNFDKVLYEKIKKYPFDKLKKELKKISKKFITLSSKSPKIEEFPNMFISCSLLKDKNQEYCKRKKLIIERKKFDELIEIMAADMKNPMKEKWLFSSLMLDKVITFFKFIRRPFEDIYIIQN